MNDFFMLDLVGGVRKVQKDILQKKEMTNYDEKDLKYFKKLIYADFNPENYKAEKQKNRFDNLLTLEEEITFDALCKKYNLNITILLTKKKN